MHMYGRYELEIPKLTYEYDEQAPWGKARDKESIVNEYVELQTRLRENGFNFWNTKKVLWKYYLG